ncbi:hypothetical protein CVT25_007713 [Psilocybe cyanescens]|uniref:GmrSD restriction endonucleases C-terminal domain-containing protein n=1 Tax=Psilocybe cyanescens TaxID=93625 RepID=A0A409XPI4_PSICY|nr:hypothetical protein CVT25_007713 [Psilocybe cyanescens]
MYIRNTFLSILAVSAAVLSSPLRRDIPTPVDGETARQFLSELVVAVDSNDPPYSRSLFKTWDLISGNCDTRETVLKRDGTNVVTNNACASVSGNWVSPYDGVPTTLASDLDIDHLVPLKEVKMTSNLLFIKIFTVDMTNKAWLSGARDWTPAQREAFANDLTRPQLVAITDNLNESKGDRDVAHFLPPLASYVCTYVRAWVTVKHFYSLTIDTAEQAALTTQLANC